MTQTALSEFNTERQGLNRVLEAILVVVILALFTAHAGVNVYNILTNQPIATQIPWAALTLIFSAFVLAHAVYMLGWRRGLAFLGVATVVGFCFEFVGEKTGLVFGRYYYTDVLGPKILDTVPVIIPLAYFMVAYPCYLIANLLITGKPVHVYPEFGALLFASLLTGLVMTAWDLTLDPLLVDEVRAWVWVDGGPYFGVPFHNFIGWVITTTTMTAAYRLVERRLPLKPLGPVSHWLVLLPLIGYGMLGLGDLFIGYPLATRVVAPFTMGVALLASVLRLYGPGPSANLPGPAPQPPETVAGKQGK